MEVIEWDRHPIFAAFVARALELAMELDNGTLTFHTDMDLLARRRGEVYYPTRPLIEVMG